MNDKVASYHDLRTLGLDKVIAEAYSEFVQARAILLKIGFPKSRISNFRDANSFWVETFCDIEQGAVAGPAPECGFDRLLRQCAEDLPGNPNFRRWHPDSELSGSALGPKAESRQPGFDVLLSYNSKDVRAVDAIARGLVQRGVRPWFDKWHLPHGAIIEQVIREAIQGSRALAVLVGPTGLGPWQNMETSHAVQWFLEKRTDMPLIPVLLPGGTRHTCDLHLGLSGRRWLEFQDLDDPFAMDDLQRAICGSPVLAAEQPLQGGREHSYEKVRELQQEQYRILGTKIEPS